MQISWFVQDVFEDSIINCDDTQFFLEQKKIANHTSLKFILLYS